MLLIVLLPLCDAARLLNDEIFVFFVGRSLPRWTIVVCVFAIVVYAATVALFLFCAREEHKSEQSVLMIFMAVGTALGLCLLSLSTPLQAVTAEVSNEILFNIQWSAHTQRLCEHASALQNLRDDPECAAEISIEQCKGFQAVDPYTSFLKTLEVDYSCTGFCQPLTGDKAVVPAGFTTQSSAVLATTQGPSLTAVPAAGGGTTASATATAAVVNASVVGSTTPLPQEAQLLAKARRSSSSGRSALQGRLKAALHSLKSKPAASTVLQQRMQTAVRAKDQRDPLVDDSTGYITPLSFLQESMALHRSAARSSALAPEGSNPVGYQPGKVGQYPPTLFSQANYQATCDGTVARVLEYKAADVAHLLFVEGMVLLFSAVILSMLKVGGMCLDGLSLSATERTLQASYASKPRMMESSF